MSNRRYRLLKDIHSMDLTATAGDIGIQTESDKYDEANKVWFDNGRYYFYLSRIKEFPDWFEEIKEVSKDWEILKYKLGERTFPHDALNWHEKSIAAIYSVRRLSDNEVFCIGDEIRHINHKDLEVKIDEFVIKGGEMYAAGCGLQYIQKSKPKEEQPFQWSRERLLNLIEYTKASSPGYGISRILSNFYEDEKSKQQNNLIPSDKQYNYWDIANPSQLKTDRIEVAVGRSQGERSADVLSVVTSHIIRKDKFPLIKQAIEQVLNDDVKAYDGKGRGKEWGNQFERLAYWGTHSGWRYCGDCKEPIIKLSHFERMVDDIHKDSQPTYTQEQVNKMMEDAFNAARFQ